MSKLSLLTLPLLAAAAPLSAQQILLDKTAVIGANTVYGSGTNGTDAAFQRVTDSNGTSPRVTDIFGAGNIFDHQQGAISEGDAQTGYWLAGDNRFYAGAYPAWITVDLGSRYDLDSFELFNTHNGLWNDRGTADFEIWASNGVLTDGANGFKLNDQAIKIAGGTLTTENSNHPELAAQDFASLSNSGFRYIQLRAVSAAASGQLVNPPYGASIAYGINELRVFGTAAAVPEPASWAMMLGGFGLVGGTLRRRTTRVFFA